VNEPQPDRPSLALLEYRISVAEAGIKALVLEVEELKLDAAQVARTLKDTEKRKTRRSSTVTTISVMVAGALLTGVIALIIGVLQSGH
jgi:hypothetical protein